MTDGTFALEPTELGLSGVHAALLPTGKVLYFSYYPPEENNVDLSRWQLWDEDAGPLSPAAFDLDRNLFCSAHCWLGDGRLLVAAGQSWNWVTQGIWGADHDIHVFDPDRETWSRHQDMPGARYYPTCVTLAGGNGFICGGAWTRVPNSVNHDSETFDRRTDAKSPAVPFNPGHITELYPFLQLLPDGSPQGLLFVYARAEARLFEIGTGTWRGTRFVTQLGKNRNYPQQGTCVLLPLLPDAPKRVRILVVGGEGNGDEATDTAEILDLDMDDPEAATWRIPSGGNPAHKRFMGDAVLLADGSVLLVNGAAGGKADDSHGPVMQAELFDPVNETWRGVASLNRERMYHSTALLLPSGRVAVAGNTEHWNPDNPVEDKTVEIYSPPYLDQGDQPRITGTPGTVAFGEGFQVSSPDAARITRAAFVRSGSVTHTNNMDQRWVGLAIEARGQDRLALRAPANGTIAPPGHYMLFLLDEAGVPSVARMVHLDPEALAPGRVLTVDRWLTVRESDAEVDTGIDLQPGDEIAFEANGTIWAGVWLTGRNGPNGWDRVDHDTKFPLHEGTSAHPFCLIGRFGDLPWFFVGERRDRERYAGDRVRRLFLRTNDDTPGNGNGEFQCRVQVWSEQAAVAGVEIASVEANPAGGDVQPETGEHVVLRNGGASPVAVSGWYVRDLAGHRLVIGPGYQIAPNATLRVYTGPGTNGPDRFYRGRMAAILNNTGDTIELCTSDGSVIDSHTY